MSINALGVVSTNPLQQVTNGSGAKTAQARSPIAAHSISSGDTTSFTSDKHTVQSLSQAAVQVFPTRQAKVEALKQEVNGAQYKLDSAKIAESLVNSDV